jgi:hypothetical protein
MAFKALPVADPVAGAVVDSISLGIAPWHPLWVLTKDWNSAAGAHQQCHLTCSFLDSRAHHTPPPSRAVTSAG